MELLHCSVMPYSWGSRTAIASLTGRPSPSDGPEAELWMGAHPVAPSHVTRAGVRTSLRDVVARSPVNALGKPVMRALGSELPFLLKVLAAAEPLSLQAHPTQAQARAGFDDEERRGIPLSSPQRNYKDRSHKPELLCALTPFQALSGFRHPGETRRLFDALAVEALAEVLAPLRASPTPEGLAASFRTLMTLPRERHAELVELTLRACAREGGAFPRERALALRLGKLHPGDIGIVSALFLEFVELAPGEAIFLDAGNMHAYVEGTGVEIMASSDNVLRGGLTPKHVDVPELLSVLDFAAGPAPILRPKEVDAHEFAYETPAAEFRLSRLSVRTTPPMPLRRTVSGPEILLVTEGFVQAGEVTLHRGSSAFVAASVGMYALSGEGTVFRATTNLTPST